MDNNIEFFEQGNDIFAWQDITNNKLFYQKAYKTIALKHDLCDEIIMSCEKRASENLKFDKHQRNNDINSEGWFSTRDPSYNVLTMPIKLINQETRNKLNSVIKELIHQCAQIYNIDLNRIYIKQQEVVKYSCKILDGQTKLREHQDECNLTFNIQLNKPHEFRGGESTFHLV